MNTQDWLNIHYLLAGIPIQRAAYAAITQTKILEILREFTPTLAGTIPLDIDIPGSDLDILCEEYDFPSFARLVQKHFAYLADFEQKTKSLNGVQSLISRFTWELESNHLKEPLKMSFPIEIVAQPVPTQAQRAFRHMVAEAQLLAAGGETARQAIRTLKLSGLKTEPAFGSYFQLEGEPYLTLLEMAGSSPSRG